MLITSNLTFKGKSPLTVFREKFYQARHPLLKFRNLKKLIKLIMDSYLRRAHCFHARSTAYSQGKKVLILMGWDLFQLTAESFQKNKSHRGQSWSIPNRYSREWTLQSILLRRKSMLNLAAKMRLEKNLWNYCRARKILGLQSMPPDWIIKLIGML